MWREPQGPDCSPSWVHHPNTTILCFLTNDSIFFPSVTNEVSVPLDIRNGWRATPSPVPDYGKGGQEVAQGKGGMSPTLLFIFPGRQGNPPAPNCH